MSTTIRPHAFARMAGNKLTRILQGDCVVSNTTLFARVLDTSHPRQSVSRGPCTSTGRHVLSLTL